MFKIGSVDLEYLSHPYNCGTGKRKTERCIEIPLALYWMDKINNPYEIGAVLPYYENNLIHDVVDPVDPKATIKESLFDVDFTGMDVISISTIEHIGTGDYGIDEEGASGILALGYILNNCNRCLITWGAGYNQDLDAHVFGEKMDDIGNIFIFSRQKDESWMEVSKKWLLPYGLCMANSIIVIEKGGIF